MNSRESDCKGGRQKLQSFGQVEDMQKPHDNIINGKKNPLHLYYQSLCFHPYKSDFCEEGQPDQVSIELTLRQRELPDFARQCRVMARAGLWR